MAPTWVVTLVKHPLRRLADAILVPHRCFTFVGAMRLLARTAVTRRSCTVRARLRAAGTEVSVRTRSPDLAVVHQIFVREVYGFPTRREPRVVVDAGAHIGMSSLYFAQRFPTARIIAIEPHGENFELLRENTRAFPQIEPLRAALWGTAATLRTVDPGLGNWAYRAEPVEPAEGPRAASGVPGVTVDGLLAARAIAHVDILKVDIEGAEADVFADPSAWIDRVDTVAIELHDRYRPGCSQVVEAALRSFDTRVDILDVSVFSRSAPRVGR